jgi:sugar-specific transcriptional regulator TrmB
MAYASPLVGRDGERMMLAEVLRRCRCRPAVSQHLRVLKDAELVRVRPEGTRRIYAVDPEGLRTMRAELESFWSAALSNFKRLAETEPPETE